MWAPKFVFDSDERLDGVDETDVQPYVTASAMLRGALIVGGLALVLFTVAPGIDLTLARLFYLGDRHFIGNAGFLIPSIRLAFNIFFYLICAVTILGLVMAARNAGPWLDLTVGKWLFIALCLITGPLVVANIGFKDHWGRARPRDIVEFDGSKAFTAPFPPSGQCDYNCSFVSGEASSIFIVMFAAALMFKSRSRNFVRLGIVSGSLAGLMRMSQGGHFLSDVIFAGVLMAITAASIQILFDTLNGEQARPIEQGAA
ncbi:phosphatase PAP2 family protein [Hyphomicrobium sp.]|jgi:lipid A 4'-phosphatase|uniref:phosphatase PAP2 family protein n=1 Tax=Hyphomicrobium sp. TaxID=82 RepID=UPI003567A779